MWGNKPRKFINRPKEDPVNELLRNPLSLIGGIKSIVFIIILVTSLSRPNSHELQIQKDNEQIIQQEQDRYD